MYQEVLGVMLLFKAVREKMEMKIFSKVWVFKPTTLKIVVLFLETF